MEELVKTFHIDVSLLIAQFVNFAIVLLILYKFAYGPILKTLNDRTEKIEKGLKDAEDVSIKIEEIGKKEKKVLAEARMEAQEIISKAENMAKKNKEEIIIEAKSQAEKFFFDAEKKINEERNKMFDELKGEIAGLVVRATEKLFGEKMDESRDKSFINKVTRN